MPDTPKKSQSDKFKDVARQIGADATEAEFEETLRKMAKARPPILKAKRNQTKK